MSPRSDPFERLPRALHPLDQPPTGPAWNHAELADLLPADVPLRLAAVLVALVEREGGPRVLLTRRTEALRLHAGQVSFPGGRIEADDADPVAAALREADEEVGLAAAQSSPLGYLDPFVTITGFHVYPVVATVVADYRPRLDPSEVAEAFEVPLDFLLDPANVHELEVDWHGRRRRLLEYRYDGHRIWGATAAMLVNFRQRLDLAR
ncbi:MAG TPA: CoA pyrophosphatase [Arenimonas sp.]|nr:CoA pyrophosphatase [Arenimonas sp.]HEU0153328.1 CoA pyrophosphatase [Arenimonas sp.]